jgi:hypothetical protein
MWGFEVTFAQDVGYDVMLPALSVIRTIMCVLVMAVTVA